MLNLDTRIKLISSDQSVVGPMAPQILLLPLPIAGNFQCSTALRTVQLETLREAGVHFFSLLVEAKQHFILLKCLCGAPRPCTTPAIIKPTFAETEESTTEHLPSTCGSYSSKGCWEMYTHRNVVWFWNSSTFVSSPASRAGGGHCCPSWGPPLWPRTALGCHTRCSRPEDCKETELAEEITARCGTLAALCTGVRKAVFTYWKGWSLIIYFSWHVEALLSNETLLCAKCSRHGRGNIISMKRLYPGKAGHKHINRERSCQRSYFQKLNKQTNQSLIHEWLFLLFHII